MKETLKLRNPVYVDGETVYNLEYDPEEITVELFDETAKRFGMSALPKEFNDRLHLGLFWAAVIAVHPKNLTFSELENAKGMYDLTRMMDIGRSFTMGSEDLQESDSDPTSETIQEPFTPEQAKSESKS